MTDLVYCHNHMTDALIGSIDEPTVLEQEFFEAELSDEELVIPAHAVPPNPDDCEALPSQVHPSYPYGDPTKASHPAARPRTNGDPTSRALFEDMMYIWCAAGEAPGMAALRWKDLALDHLLPVDKEKADAEEGALARKNAVGNIPMQNPAAENLEDGEDNVEEEESQG